MGDEGKYVMTRLSSSVLSGEDQENGAFKCFQQLQISPNWLWPNMALDPSQSHLSKSPSVCTFVCAVEFPRRAFPDPISRVVGEIAVQD